LTRERAGIRPSGIRYHEAIEELVFEAALRLWRWKASGDELVVDFDGGL
jgi:hypothetical protein